MGDRIFVRNHQHGRQAEYMSYALTFCRHAIPQGTTLPRDRRHFGIRSRFLLCTRLPMQSRPFLLATCSRRYRWTVRRPAHYRHRGLRLLGSVRRLRLDDGFIALVCRAQDANGLSVQVDGGIRPSYRIYVSSTFPLSAFTDDLTAPRWRL